MPLVTRAGKGSRVKHAEMDANLLGLADGSLLALPRVTLTDTFIERDGANILAQRNGVNAQSLRVYNTFTADGAREYLEVNASPTSTTIAQKFEGVGALGRNLFMQAPASKSVFLQGNGNVNALQADGVDSGINWLKVTGSATGLPVKIGAVGADSNIALRVHTKGTGHLAVITGSDDSGSTGAEQLRIAHVASAVNYVQAQGAATGQPVAISAQGEDTNVALWFSSKGSQSINFLTDNFGFNAFVIGRVANAVNYLQVVGGATGSQVNIGAEGSDTNINLRAYTKGTGQFEVITNGSSGSRQFVVIHTASAVNYVSISGSATGNKVTISAAGSDTNVGMQIQSQGSGNIDLQPNSGDIAWEKPLVALGGGATPTLGTIGGSGPATAAQNSWMRVLDSTGAAFWVPAWK